MSSSPDAAPIHIGFLGAARIARKNSWALKLSGAGVPAVVAAREAPAAEEFARAWGFERGIGGYDALLADASLQAVYVPIPTALRAAWCVAAARAGKAVLIEKPACVTLAELQAVAAACAAAGVQLMDGVMFMHHTRTKAWGRVFSGGSIGTPRLVTSTFGFSGDEDFHSGNIRTDPALEPAGVLGDLSWYSIRLALLAFDWAPPSHAACDVHARSAKGVPIEATTTLYWPDGRRAVALNSFLCAFVQSATIVGTRGVFQCDDFVLPRDSAAFTVVENPGMRDCDRIVDMSPVSVVTEVEHGHQESRMWAAFCELVRGGAASRDKFWPRIALLTQAALDAACASAAAGGARVEVSPIGEDF